MEALRDASVAVCDASVAVGLGCTLHFRPVDEKKIEKKSEQATYVKAVVSGNSTNI